MIICTVLFEFTELRIATMFMRNAGQAAGNQTDKSNKDMVEPNGSAITK